MLMRPSSLLAYHLRVAQGMAELLAVRLGALGRKCS